MIITMTGDWPVDWFRLTRRLSRRPVAFLVYHRLVVVFHDMETCREMGQSMGQW